MLGATRRAAHLREMSELPARVMRTRDCQLNKNFFATTWGNQVTRCNELGFTVHRRGVDIAQTSYTIVMHTVEQRRECVLMH